MSEKTVFISYRRDGTGRFFARSIKDALTHKGYDVFLDVDCMDAGQWTSQILTQVPKRAHFLLLLTPGALDRCVDEHDWVRREFLTAVQHGRNIVPVREESLELNAARSSCPPSVRAVFDYQIATIQNATFESDVTTLVTRYIPPHNAPAKTESHSDSPAFTADISRIIKYAPTELIGREAETKLLADAWDKVVSGEAKRPHILTFVALGGEGKTSLVAKWAASLAHDDWPGCKAVFAWSFYSQGTREQSAVSSDTFLTEALTFFGDTIMAGSAQGAFDKGRRLAHLVGEKRALLILDGLEPLQYPPTSPTPGEFKDQGIDALLKGLAATNHGLCVVTTRYPLTDLRAYLQTTAPMQELPRLSTAAGVRLLRIIGVKAGSQVDFERLVEDVDGHALTLQIIGQFLVRSFQGDIRRRDRIDIQKADSKIQGGHAFRAMGAYVKWLENDSEEMRREVALLKLLGLFDRPATVGCVAALRQAPPISGLTESLVGLAEEDWEFSLTSLRDAKLLTVNREEASGVLVALDAHPLLREYFAGQLRAHQPDAWRSAHRRLYEHLCATTPDKRQPSLEDLQPLYQAVVHGCEAGLQEEARAKVYLGRIQRGREAYSTKRLGAVGSDLGIVACFFEAQWSRVSPSLGEATRASLLNNAAFFLRALGRLNEARDPMQAVLRMRIKQEDWSNAAIGASNLSELELTLGKVGEAVREAEQAVIYADHSGNAFHRHSKRCTLGEALHQAGRQDEAKALFAEAARIQAESQPTHLILYSVSGFRYCDLLLARVERAAWQLCCTGGLRSPRADDGHQATLDSVSQHAARALQIVLNGSGSLLDIALNHLTLGRATLYRAILDSAVSLLPTSISEITVAVTGLRSAGTTHHIPRALLTRAWLRSLAGAPTGSEGAQSDLNEAWEIAGRGPMPLFLIDIHLHRVRLFFREKTYPWDSPQTDVAAARLLIEKHGYWRRKEELEDAEEAINKTLTQS